MEILSIALLIVTVLICFLSSVSDFKSMTIPNWHSGVIIILFFPAYFLMPNHLFPLWQHIAACVFMFFASYLMFHFKAMGGGDSKLMTAVSLWLGVKGLMPFLLFTALSGGLLGIAALYLQKHKIIEAPIKDSWIDKCQQGVSAVPYAIAITVGYLLSIYHITMSFN